MIYRWVKRGDNYFLNHKTKLNYSVKIFKSPNTNLWGFYLKLTYPTEILTIPSQDNKKVLGNFKIIEVKNKTESDNLIKIQTEAIAHIDSIRSKICKLIS
jgi:hypothetical protein